MKNLRNIRSKIFLVVGIPTILAIVFSLVDIEEKYSVYKDMGEVRTLSNVATQISSLVHETQKERGMTGIFLNSAGKEFASRLNVSLF